MPKEYKTYDEVTQEYDQQKPQIEKLRERRDKTRKIARDVARFVDDALSFTTISRQRPASRIVETFIQQGDRIEGKTKPRERY